VSLTTSRRRLLISSAVALASAGPTACGAGSPPSLAPGSAPPPPVPGGTLGLGIVGIIVADLPASLAFYRRLGLAIPPDLDTSEGAFRLPLPNGMILFWETVAYVRGFDSLPTEHRRPPGRPRVRLRHRRRCHHHVRRPLGCRRPQPPGPGRLERRQHPLRDHHRPRRQPDLPTLAPRLLMRCQLDGWRNPAAACPGSTAGSPVSGSTQMMQVPPGT